MALWVKKVPDTWAREYLKYVIAVCDAFVERKSGKWESVLIQLREGASETFQNNRKKLCSITEIIVLCGQQNLRCHRDSVSDMEGLQTASTNHGNFCVLLNFRISAGDTILRDHLQSAARNAIYIPPTRISWPAYLVTIFVMQS